MDQEDTTIWLKPLCTLKYLAGKRDWRPKQYTKGVVSKIPLCLKRMRHTVKK